MISEELNNRVDSLLKRNKALIERSRQRSRQRRREIERSASAVERIVRQLRQGSSA